MMPMDRDMAAISAQLKEQGHVKVDALFSKVELDQAESLLDSLMESPLPLIRYSRHTLGATNDSVDGHQVELIKPFLLSRELRHCELFHKAQAFSSALLQAKAHYQFDHAIYKGGREEATVPWHQDQAYTGSKKAIPSIHLWIPFQDTGPHNGSMEFVIGNPNRLLPHKPLSEGQKTLTLAAPPDKPVQALQIARGDVSIHNNFTIHRSGPNRSDQTRKAWILHFSASSIWIKYWSKVTGRFQANGG